MQNLIFNANNNTFILYFIIYILVINIIAFLTMGYDKYLAKNNKWRISEKTLFIISFLFGGIGTYIGMYTFRHKTKHKKFTILIPIIILLNIIAIIYILKKLITN